MPREMFGDVVDPSVKVGTKQWYTVPLSILAHVVVLGALIVIPLMATDVLPNPTSVMAFAAAAPPPPPPPPPPPAPPPPSTPTPKVEVNPNAAPTEPPKEIKPEPPPAPPSYSMQGVVGGVAGGIPGGTVGGVVGGIPPPPPPPAPPQAPVHVGGDIQAPQKIKDVPPSYPQIAQTAKVQGVVIIEATIATNGTIKDAKILRGQSLLNEAALEAVRQWRYRPTMLNGSPVEVIMTVTVNFKLGG